LDVRGDACGLPSPPLSPYAARDGAMTFPANGGGGRDRAEGGALLACGGAVDEAVDELGELDARVSCGFG